MRHCHVARRGKKSHTPFASNPLSVGGRCVTSAANELRVLLAVAATEHGRARSSNVNGGAARWRAINKCGQGAETHMPRASHPRRHLTGAGRLACRQETWE